jgi:hypothetical protein
MKVVEDNSFFSSPIAIFSVSETLNSITRLATIFTQQLNIAASAFATSSSRLHVDVKPQHSNLEVLSQRLLQTKQQAWYSSS